MTSQSGREITWRKSSRSDTANSGCVEIAVFGTEVFVRDSKDRTGPVLRFRRAEWHALLGGVKSGEITPG